MLRRVITTALPFFVSAVVPAVVVGGLFLPFLGADFRESRGIFLMIAMFSALHVLVLGVPGVILLRRKHMTSWGPVLLLGIVAGCVPIGVFMALTRESGSDYSASLDGIRTVINGRTTVAGWLVHIREICFYGACGGLAAAGYQITADLLAYPARRSRPGT